MSNFNDLVTSAAERASVGTNDPWFSRVPARVNEAILEFSAANFAGWDWLWRTVVATFDTDDYVLSFDDLACLVANNDPDVDGVPIWPCTRVHSAALYDATSTTWPRTPALGVTRAELDQGMSSTADGGCYLWTAEGQEFRIAPPAASDGITFELRILLTEGEYEYDPSSPAELLCPARYHHVITGLARALVFEMKQDFDAATAARKVYEGQVMRAVASSRPRGGPGRIVA